MVQFIVFTLLCVCVCARARVCVCFLDICACSGCHLRHIFGTWLMIIFLCVFFCTFFCILFQHFPTIYGYFEELTLYDCRLLVLSCILPGSWVFFKYVCIIFGISTKQIACLYWVCSIKLVCVCVHNFWHIFSQFCVILQISCVYFLLLVTIPVAKTRSHHQMLLMWFPLFLHVLQHSSICSNVVYLEPNSIKAWGGSLTANFIQAWITGNGRTQMCRQPIDPFTEIQSRNFRLHILF